MARPTTKHLELMTTQRNDMKNALIAMVDEYAEPVRFEQLLKDNKGEFKKFYAPDYLVWRYMGELVKDGFIRAGHDKMQKNALVFWSNELKDVALPQVEKISAGISLPKTTRHVRKKQTVERLNHELSKHPLRAGAGQKHKKKSGSGKSKRPVLTARDHFIKTGEHLGRMDFIAGAKQAPQGRQDFNMHGADVKIDIDKNTGRVKIAARGVVIDLGVV